MSHILTLELPEDVFEAARELASQQGEAVNDYCLRHLRADIEAEQQRVTNARHPLLQLAGVFDSGTPDLAARHDAYLAAEVMNSHDDEP